MKKLILLISTLGLFNVANAQNSYEVIDVHNGNANVTGGTLDFWTSPGNKVMLELGVKNISSSTKVTKCKRVFVSGIVSMVDTVELCWSSCYAPNWNTTQISGITPTTGNISILAGVTVSNVTTPGTGFHATFKTNVPNYGTKTVRYVFYDNTNHSDSAYVIVNYHLTATGLNDIDAKSFLLSEPSPNPASSSTSIKYDFPAAAKTSIRLYNAMGSVVREFKIEDLNGKITINTEDLAGGLYFYSLMVNDKATATKKLVISH